ncbi:hypothetical protein HFP72_04410 [Nocardiopsis sp. ARC36]
MDYLRRAEVGSFADWAEQVEELHGVVGSRDLQGIIDLYSHLVPEAGRTGSQALSNVAKRLSHHVLNYLEGRGAKEPTEEVRSLVDALSVLERVLAVSASMPDQPGSLMLLQDNPEGREVSVSFGRPGEEGRPGAVSYREAQALEALVGFLHAVATEASVEAVQDDSGVLVIVSGVGPVPSVVTTLVNLLAEAVPTLSFEADEGECTMVIAPVDRVGSLLQAGARSLRKTVQAPPRFARVVALLKALFGADAAEGRKPAEQELDELYRELARMS